MPFRSRSQQGYLFANKPDVAREFADATPKGAYKQLPKHVAKKKADVSGEALRNQTPTKSFGPLSPTDKPTQQVTLTYPESKSVPNLGVKKEAQAFCGLYLAHLTKSACDRREAPTVARLTKLAEVFVATRDLGQAIDAAWPDESPENRRTLKLALVRNMRAKHAECLKDAGWLRDSAGWLEDAPGRAWQGTKNMVGGAWQGVKNFFSPVGRAIDAATTTVGNFGRGLGGAWDGLQQGFQRGYSGQAPVAPQAPAAPPPTPAAAAPPKPVAPKPVTSFTRSFGPKLGMQLLTRKLAETTTVPVPQPASPPTAPRNIPTSHVAPKRQVRYSFNRAPAKPR